MTHLLRSQACRRKQAPTDGREKVQQSVEVLLRGKEKSSGTYSLVRALHLPLTEDSMLHGLLEMGTLPGNSYGRSMGTQQTLFCTFLVKLHSSGNPRSDYLRLTKHCSLRLLTLTP